MVCSTTRRWNACSPDGIEILSSLNGTDRSFPWSTYSLVSFEGLRYPIACIEVKTAVSRKSSDPHILNLEVDLDVQELGDSNTLQYIPKQHVVQIAHQMSITGCNCCVYTLTSEMSPINAVFVYF